MNNKEAIELLKDLPDRIVSMILPSDKPFDYKQALNLAIKALTKEAKKEERKAQEKVEREKIERFAILYKDLKEGELFRITSVLNDKRIYRKDREGSTKIYNKYGDPCNYKIFPYLTMVVYKLG